MTVETYDPDVPVRFGQLRDPVTKVTVNAMKVKYSNLTYTATDEYVNRVLEKALRYAPDGVVLFRLPYDQGLVNAIRALVDKPFGIGRNIRWWRNDWKRGWIKIKLHGDNKWSV